MPICIRYWNSDDVQQLSILLFYYFRFDMTDLECLQITSKFVHLEQAIPRVVFSRTSSHFFIVHQSRSELSLSALAFAWIRDVKNFQVDENVESEEIQNKSWWRTTRFIKSGLKSYSFEKILNKQRRRHKKSLSNVN